MERRWRARAFPLPEPELGVAEGAGILSEDSARLGVLLWDLARDVVLWACARGPERDELFAPATQRLRQMHVLTAPSDPCLDFGLAHLVRVVAEPHRADRTVVALACRKLSQWADDRGALATAYAFAHAAACTEARRAEWSYHAGRLARRRADYVRAEEWLTRAVLLGRQTRDWEAAINARGGLGNVAVQRGSYPKAERHHRRALQRARVQGLRDLEGTALHSLCAVAGERGRVEEMNAYARAAHEVLGTGHPHLARLAHDVADVWMNQGLFAQALRVFEATLPHLESGERVVTLANVCRAAAGAGARGQYNRAWTDVWSRIETAEEHAAQALLDLALGASAFREWDRAEAAARRSLEIAMERREGRVRIAAESVLESVAREQAAGARPAEPATPAKYGLGVYEEASALAEDFAGSLAACAGA